jgi:recombination protein RecT
VVASTVTAEKMSRIALNELRKNEYLAKLALNNPDSFINSVMQASHLGLEIGGALGQAYLVPFKNEVTMIPGYRGLLTLARRSGFITSIKAEMVYEKDTFELELGIQTKVVHKPLLDGERGKPKLVYMVAHFTDGGYHFEWMSIAEVDKIRKRSPSGEKGPWVTDYEQMALKTVIRRGWKYLPMSIEMQNAEKIERAVDDGKAAGLVIDGDSVEIDVTEPQEAAPEVDPNKPTFDQLQTQIGNCQSEGEIEFVEERVLDHDDDKERKQLLNLLSAKRKGIQATPSANSTQATTVKADPAPATSQADADDGFGLID